MIKAIDQWTLERFNQDNKKDGVDKSKTQFQASQRCLNSPQESRIGTSFQGIAPLINSVLIERRVILKEKSFNDNHFPEKRSNELK